LRIPGNLDPENLALKKNLKEILLDFSVLNMPFISQRRKLDLYCVQDKIRN
jgi:hypothetical protein